MRDADLVSPFNSNTIVILPADDVMHGLSAFVGRLRAHLRDSWETHREIATACEPKVVATWLDPKDVRPVPGVLADAFGLQQP